jgi:hypothetical protein
VDDPAGHEVVKIREAHEGEKDFAFEFLNFALFATFVVNICFAFGCDFAAPGPPR